ncbi:Ig-like domain-containing protein [Paenibacillus sp. FSL H3-0333]|uniref:Ig-like domain-containing protein n=1 Tax=Paenibacillus sp. FSL H3-0333 TaxID=2921373 RepID=UPI0030FCF0DF
MKKTRLYLVSGAALLMLLILPFWKLMTDVAADQTSGYVAKATLLLERTITTDSGTVVTGNLPVNQSIRLNYTITPQAVNDSNAAGIKEQIVSNLVFTEKLPANINIQDSSLPAGFKKEVDPLTTGYTITGTLTDIPYTWNQSKQAYIANIDSGQTNKVFSFSIPAQVSNTGSYNFSNASLSFDDIHAIAAATATPTPTTTFNPSTSTTKSVLGAAGDYNVFVFGEAKLTATLEGNLASGGNTTVSGIDLNKKNTVTVPYALVTGGDLDFKNGTVKGNIYHQGTFHKVDSGTIEEGKYYQGPVGKIIDFTAAKNYLENFSASYANASTNGTIEPYALTGNNTVNTFRLANNYFNQNLWPSLTAKSGSSVVIILPGETVTIKSTFTSINGITGSNILYLFPEATSINISNVDMKGSILAPKARVNFTNGQVHGNIVAASINSSSLIANLPYKGQLPVFPTPAPTATPSPTPVPTTAPRATLVFSPITLTVIQPVTDIQLAGTTLVVGEHKQLTAIVVPSNASITALQWSSADPAIATVDQSGQVTGVAAGTARITASATDGSGVSRTVDVLVKNVAVTDIQLEGATLNVGESKPLTVTVAPVNATNPALQWSSAEPGIVTVDQNGQVTGVAPGTARVTASATDGSGVSRTVDVLVNKVAVTDILLEGTTLIVDESKQLNATIVPSNASITTLQWSSANSGIVTVDQNGQITGVAAGTAQITASATDGSGVSRTVNVLVKKVAIEVTDILLQGANLTVNESKQLNATVVPTNASLPVLEWSSNKAGIVTVDQSGMVTGIAEGIAQITASATDGSGVSRTVDVVVNFQRTLTIVGENSTTIKTGLDLTADYTGPAGETGMKYEWTIVSGATGSTLNPKSGKNTIFTAASPGEYTVQLSFTSDIITTPIIETKQISVSKILLADFNLNGAKQVYAGRDLNLSLDLKPKNADIAASEIIWSISGDNAGTFASLSSTDTTKLGNTLVAKKVKTDSSGNALNTTVTVSATIGSITKDIKVDILPMTIRFSKNTISIPASNKLGDDNHLKPLLWLYPSDIPVEELVWTSSNDSNASFADVHDGIIIGRTPGNVVVTVSYKPSQYAEPVSATIIVQVKLPDNKDKY